MKNKEEKFAELITKSFLEYSKQILFERINKGGYNEYRPIYTIKK